MTDAQAPLKKRLAIMAIVNVVAVLAAGSLLVGYLKFGQGWALPGFIAAMAVGFMAQIWFIAGLRGSGRGV
ncbi:MAG: hypothetical protein JSR98_22215 [Proteobacteria bacterium]|nr:hypothetical protein [Pseudomonadota bacterium]